MSSDIWADLRSSRLLFLFLSFLYLIGFTETYWSQKVLTPAPLGPWLRHVVNLALILIFALQHSVMARPGFKKAWTRIIPESVERSTYVLLSTLALICLALWQPMPGVIWDAVAQVLHGAHHRFLPVGAVFCLDLHDRPF